MTFINKLAAVIPERMARAIVAHDAENFQKAASNQTKPGTPPNLDAMRDARNENVASSLRGALCSIPYFSFIVGLFMTVEAIDKPEGIDGPVVAAKLVGANGVMPMASNFGGPIGWGFNAAVNLTWASVDLMQAAAWEKIRSIES